MEPSPDEVEVNERLMKLIRQNPLSTPPSHRQKRFFPVRLSESVCGPERRLVVFTVSLAQIVRTLFVEAMRLGRFS